MSTAAPGSRRLNLSLPILLDVAALGLAGAGNALMAASINLAPPGLGLIAIALVLRVAQARLKLFAIPLLLPWLLFLLSAWIGVTVSFAPASSLVKFNLIVGSISLYYVIAATQTDLAKRLVVWGVVLVGAGAAVYYLTQTDFAANPTKVATLDQIGFAIHRLAPQFGLSTPHPNRMAGIILLALPFAVGLMYEAVVHRRVLVLLTGSAITALLAFGLIMTTSRGALLALILLVIVSGYGYGAVRLANRVGLSSGIGLAGAFNLVLIVLLVGFALSGTRLADTLNAILGSVSTIPRVELYQQVFQLAQDYAFTGAGLGTFSPNFSTYELLINVPFLPHAHDLFLQVWFEQGILGLVAFVWYIVAYYVWAVRRRARMNWLAIASIVATTLLLLHGLVDVLFYSGRVISLMFIPTGLTVCALQPFVHLSSPETTARRGWLVGAAVAGLLVLVVAFLLLTRWDQLNAQWNANLGAVRQAQLELPQLAFPKPTFEQVRREADLSQAEDLYQDALARDPNNRTAHARLGMIALSRSEFEQAIQHLEAAYRADKNNRAVIKSLGYAYAWTANLEQAEVLLKQIPEATVELNYSISDWRSRGRTDLAANAQKLVQRLKP